MPATPKQMRVAGRELRMRREGKVEQEASREEANRPMGSMSSKNLRKYAQSIDKDISKLEGRFKRNPTQENHVHLQRAKNQKLNQF